MSDRKQCIEEDITGVGSWATETWASARLDPPRSQWDTKPSLKNEADEEAPLKYSEKSDTHHSKDPGTEGREDLAKLALDRFLDEPDSDSGCVVMFLGKYVGPDNSENSMDRS
ncbi:hypothetical protein FQN55_000045 [Onygenales sp. PD_40]|nr:hypothetical protein FQN55_000045 [Onygenales sp. PD_40]KAK2776312.1 hypothetical protein FQN52_003503 [Onygenales sp. PD_12]